MTDEQVRQLAQAIARHTAMDADAVGLSMTGKQLETLERLVVAGWVRRQLVESKLPTMGDWLDMYDRGTFPI